MIVALELLEAKRSESRALLLVKRASLLGARTLLGFLAVLLGTRSY